jgi:hypothetical protein
MAETIISITEVNDEWEGYEVTTDSRTIRVVIDNDQGCCESWGHLASEDDLTQFIGAELIGVEVVDSALNTKSDPGDIDQGTANFVNFNTNRGKLQLSVYDSHNGYYGHGVEITGLTKQEHGLVQ